MSQTRRQQQARTMKQTEIERLQAHLQRTFANKHIRIKPNKGNAPDEVYVGEEFIGVLDRDDEDGEVSYTLTMSILAEDLADPNR